MRLLRPVLATFASFVACSAPGSAPPPASTTPANAPPASATPASDVANADAATNADPCREGGDLDACVKDALARRKGGEGEKNTAINTELLAILEKACAKDHAAACEGVAELFQDWQYHAVRDDPKAGVLAWDKACRLGNKHACYRLGFYYVEWLTHGYAVDANGNVREYRRAEDHRRGVALLRDACAAGIERACEHAKNPLPP
ncbi:MAG: sel1 repeat family protein [Labilithrix sp.]|nr:sel1 repeat family protein [Labilithrix sp.]MCW5810207.1 sel1 repeat family protein [Labilithrix sp.]